MNIDLAATTGFNDPEGLRNFLLVHRFVHDQTAAALSAKFSIPVSSFGLDSQLAEDAWVQSMQAGAQGRKGARVPTSLQDWLNIHADIHNQTYTLLGQTPTVAPDLSIADFSDASSYYDWQYVHQQMHDWEYQTLGLT
jgi:hypothetical protein